MCRVLRPFEDEGRARVVCCSVLSRFLGIFDLCVLSIYFLSLHGVLRYCAEFGQRNFDACTKIMGVVGY